MPRAVHRECNLDPPHENIQEAFSSLGSSRSHRTWRLFSTFPEYFTLLYFTAITTKIIRFWSRFFVRVYMLKANESWEIRGRAQLSLSLNPIERDTWVGRCSGKLRRTREFWVKCGIQVQNSGNASSAVHIPACTGGCQYDVQQL